MNEESITTVCPDCKTQVHVSLSAKCVTCPACGWHWEFDAAVMKELLKRIMREAYGAKPDKPEHN